MASSQVTPTPYQSQEDLLLLALQADLIDQRLHKLPNPYKENPDRQHKPILDTIKVKFRKASLAPTTCDTFLLASIVKQNNLMFEYLNDIRAQIADLTDTVKPLQLPTPNTPIPPPNTDKQFEKLEGLIKAIPKQTATNPITAPPSSHQKKTAPRQGPKSYADAAKTPTPNNTAAKKKTTKQCTKTDPKKEVALPTAQRRFFCTRTSPAPLPEAEHLSSRLPILCDQFLARNGLYHDVARRHMQA